MTEETLTPATAIAPDEAGNINVCALTPADMVPAQHELIAWCDRKVQALGDEIGELELHQKLAIENGWKTSVVNASLNRAARRVTYYRKMQDALKAGYLLVPNMPVDLLAVRVKRAHEPVKTGSEWQVSQAHAQLLPTAEGRYVDDRTFTRSYEVEKTNSAGNKYTVTEHQTADYDEVDFPIALTKPVILEAAAKAMALRVFDEIGRVQNGGGGRDPILVGRLLDPRGGGRCATFFIAWWVDTSTL